MTQLYPPTIAGTLPSFYKSKVNGAATIAVPFTMNKTTKISDVSGFSLRIKTTNTDILYGIIESTVWSQDVADPVVSFIIDDEILNRFTVGSFYKVQLAYIDRYGVTGYYSSVGIMKCTSAPTVEISDFSLDTTNVNQTQYIGIYKNIDDPTEKVYQYRFNLYTKDDQLVETSDWQFHNSYEDTSLIKSIDKYMLRTALKKNVIYKIEYQIITNNGLQVKSPKYLLMEAESIDPELSAQLVAKLDYNNACINLALVGATMEDGSEYIITGAFSLSRASSLDNYSTWLPISEFRMTGQKPSSFLLKDYTVMQGVTYLYSLQQRNDWDIYSNRILSNYVEVQFEDVFLFDGHRQLRIRYNPKIASFKTVVQESKKNTLGAKYPYIFRNGITEYKEFPISGMVTYFMDENEAFISKEKDLFITDWEKTTDITDENVLLERLFKIEVLNWLNNGKPKLFKSPQEGNYIVRIMNVSFSPIDTVSRMLHNFSCQATEIAEYTPDNLITYGLLDTQSMLAYQMRWETIVFNDRVLEKDKLLAEARRKYNNGEYTENEYNRKVAKIKSNYEIYNNDLFKGQKVYHLKIDDMIMGTTFSYQSENGANTYEIMIGATGSYEVFFEEPIINLRLLNLNNSSNNGNLALQRGSVTFGIKTASQNRFDVITKIYNQNIPVYQINGPHDNILSDYQDLKHQITRLNYAKFRRLPVEEINSSLFGMNLNGNIMTGSIVAISNETKCDIQTIDTDGQVMHHYYNYFDGTLYELPHSVTLPANPKPLVLNEYTFYRDTDTKLVYHLNRNQFIDVTAIVGNNSYQYQLRDHDLNTYTIYLKRYYKESQLIEEYYKYDNVSLIKLDEYSTEISFGDMILDVAENGTREITDIENVPAFIKIGSGVSAEIGIQVKIIEYDVESSTECEDEKNRYNQYLEEYHAIALGLTLVENHSTMTVDGFYKVWDTYSFQNLALDQEILMNYHNGKYDDINVYIFIENLEDMPSQAEINEAYDKLQTAKNKYFTVLDELLREQEEANTYE